jgi:hypothetical protein
MTRWPAQPDGKVLLSDKITKVLVEITTYHLPLA